MPTDFCDIIAHDPIHIIIKKSTELFGYCGVRLFAIGNNVPMALNVRHTEMRIFAPGKCTRLQFYRHCRVFKKALKSIASSTSSSGFLKTMKYLKSCPAAAAQRLPSAILSFASDPLR